MKKVLVLMLTLVMLVGVCVLLPALAEDVAAAPVGFDATPIVAAGIVMLGAALGAFLLWLTYKYLVPLLKVPILGTLAKWAVDYAEAEMGHGEGETKYDMATAFVVRILGMLHITVDDVQIKAAIMSAWTALNLNQIIAGIKAADP